MHFINLPCSSFGGVSGLTNIGSTTCFLLSRIKASNLLKSALSAKLHSQRKKELGICNINSQ